MPRIRSIKPEFFQDEKLSPLSPTDRLVFLGLISMADDAGRLLDNVKIIDAFIFPETSDTSRDSLDTLASLSRIIRYVAPSGQKLIQARNWSDHQKVDHPNKYVLPGPTDDDLAQVVAVQDVGDGCGRRSRDSRESVAKSSRYDQRPTIYDQRPTTLTTSTADAAVSEPTELPAPPRPARRRKPKPTPTGEAAVPPRKTWLTPAQAAWEKHNGAGSFPARKAAGLLDPLAKAGLSPGDIGVRLDRYCAKRGAAYCTLADFAQHHGQYAPPPIEALRLIDGEMSAELEEETRPPGCPPPKYPLPSGLTRPPANATGRTS